MRASVSWTGTPCTSWIPPTVVRPALGKAGATTAFSRPVAPRAAEISADIGPRNVESIFL